MAFLSDLVGIVRRAVAPSRTVGASGTAVFGGFVQEREKNPDLGRRQKYVTYSDFLLEETIVGAATRYFINLVSKAEWTVEPQEDNLGNPEAEEIAEFVKDVLHDMRTPLHRVVRRTAMGRFYGFSIQEWTAKMREDGRIGLLDIEPRAQQTIERWDLDENGNVVGVVQRSPQSFVEIYLPITKTVYFVDDSINDSPEGLGLFRHIAEAARRLRRYKQLEGYGFELDLRGMPIARVPKKVLADMVKRKDLTKQQAEDIVTNFELFIKNHVQNPERGLVLDSEPHRDNEGRPSSTSQWGLEIVNGNAGPLKEIAEGIVRETRAIARVFGLENILLGETGAGSLAMARDKSKTIGLMIDGTLKEIREVYAEQIVRRLGELNGWPKEMDPELKTEAIQHRDLQEVVDALESMARAGAPLVPEDPAVGQVRDLAGLERPPAPMDLGLEDDGGWMNPEDQQNIDDTQSGKSQNDQNQQNDDEVTPPKEQA